MIKYEVHDWKSHSMWNTIRWMLDFMQNNEINDTAKTITRDGANNFCDCSALCVVRTMYSSVGCVWKYECFGEYTYLCVCFSFQNHSKNFALNIVKIPITRYGKWVEVSECGLDYERTTKTRLSFALFLILSLSAFQQQEFSTWPEIWDSYEYVEYNKIFEFYKMNPCSAFIVAIIVIIMN